MLAAACRRDERADLSVRRPSRGAALVFLSLNLASGCRAQAPLTDGAAGADPVVTLVAVGDIRLDGAVGRVAAEGGPAAPSEAVLTRLAGDIVLGNLECALTSRGKPADKKWTFRSPPGNVSILKAAGFTHLGLANNHVMDYGAEGLEDTLAALDEAGLAHIGAGPDLAAARRPLIVEVRGLKVGLLGLTSTIPESNWARGPRLGAGHGRPGVAFADLPAVGGWVRAAKALCDVLVVTYHAGTELGELPNEVQRAFAREAAGAGADVIVAHHPHVLQPVELVAGKPVLHSIGNFLFVSPTPATRWAVIARLRLERSGVTGIDFVPIDTHAGGGKLLPASPEGVAAAREALDRLGALSGEGGGAQPLGGARFRVLR